MSEEGILSGMAGFIIGWLSLVLTSSFIGISAPELLRIGTYLDIVFWIVFIISYLLSLIVFIVVIVIIVILILVAYAVLGYVISLIL